MNSGPRNQDSRALPIGPARRPLEKPFLQQIPYPALGVGTGCFQSLTSMTLRPGWEARKAKSLNRSLAGAAGATREQPCLPDASRSRVCYPPANTEGHVPGGWGGGRAGLQGCNVILNFVAFFSFSFFLLFRFGLSPEGESGRKAGCRGRGSWRGVSPCKFAGSRRARGRRDSRPFVSQTAWWQQCPPWKTGLRSPASGSRCEEGWTLPGWRVCITPRQRSDRSTAGKRHP